MSLQYPQRIEALCHTEVGGETIYQVVTCSILSGSMAPATFIVNLKAPDVAGPCSILSGSMAPATPSSAVRSSTSSVLQYPSRIDDPCYQLLLAEEVMSLRLLQYPSRIDDPCYL